MLGKKILFKNVIKVVIIFIIKTVILITFSVVIIFNNITFFLTEIYVYDKKEQNVNFLTCITFQTLLQNATTNLTQHLTQLRGL